MSVHKSLNSNLNACALGRYHMLDKIAYDYVKELTRDGSNKQKLKNDMSERAKRLSDEDKNKLRELIEKWLTK
ncbi:MAG: hypothetical protein [Caudoviricetes sp.]|nr:MAG: hypothetical protein [Caudoviricetes sp.]